MTTMVFHLAIFIACITFLAIFAIALSTYIHTNLRATNHHHVLPPYDEQSESETDVQKE